MKRILTFMMAIVMAVGLMPAPSYAGMQMYGAGIATPAEGQDGATGGLQLNEGPVSLEPYQTSPSYGVLWSYIEKGDVLVEFEGASAPRLGMRNINGDNSWVFAMPSDVTWADEGASGLARYSSGLVRETWLSGETRGASNEIGDLRKLFVQADAKAATVKRIVLTGMDALPDVSRGGYGNRTVRRLYTRAVTLKTSPDSDKRLYRTVNIDFDNPVYDGADIAVRYTGDAPYLQFCDASWGGWTSMGAEQGARTVSADDGSGERVTFFAREEIEALWSERGGANGAVRENMFVCVHPLSASYPEGSEECSIVEVVAIGGAPRVTLTDDQRSRVHGRSAEQVARAMRAGYNMAGHFESNWVPSEPAKDGGWGYSDLELEAHWARGVYITRDIVHSLKANGFGAVRVPVTWFQHIYPEGNPTGENPLPDDPLKRYHIDRAWIERVHEVVDWCIAEDLYVIVNIHHEDWIDRPDLGTAYDETDLPEKFAAVWTQIADEFAGYDQRLVFEDMNEPHAYFYTDDGRKDWGFATAQTTRTVNRLNADFVKLMRSYPASSGHGERVLMMAHDTGNGDVSYTDFVMPDDPAHNLAYSIHGYSPHNWTHYFAEGAHQGESGEDNVYTPVYRTAVDSTWDTIRSRYTSSGYPVILGEFGCYYLGEERQADRVEWMEQYATHSKELGIPMFYWRMDQTTTDNGRERVVWSAFDEEQLKLSQLSKGMFEKWFDILDDDEVIWGSDANVVEGEHAAITDENVLNASSYPLEIHFVKPGTGGVDQSWRATLRVGWDQIAGREVAVKYTGSTPRLGLVRESADENGKAWQGDWWGMSASSVDHANRIAYFSSSAISDWWTSRCPTYPLSTLSHIAVRVAESGYSPPTPEDEKLSTTIEAIALVHEHEWGEWMRAGTTEEGEIVQTRTCSSPSCTVKTQSRTLHEWGEWTTLKEAACTEEGLHVRTCLHDSAQQQRSAGARGHEWEAGFTIDVEPTCTQAGSKSVHCARCDERKDVAEIAPLGHDWGEWVTTIEPTSDAEGEQRRTCMRDAGHVEARALDKLAGDPARDAEPPGGEHAQPGQDDDAPEREAERPGQDAEPPGGEQPGREAEQPGQESEQQPGQVEEPGLQPSQPAQGLDQPEPAEQPGQETEQQARQPASLPDDGSQTASQNPPRDEGRRGDEPAGVQESPAIDAEGHRSAAGDDVAGYDAPPSTERSWARVGSASVLVDVAPNGEAIVRKARASAKGTLKVNTATTASGRKLKVAEVSGGAFSGAKVTGVVIGANVTTLGSRAFKNCRKLSQATIGANVKYVGKAVFKGCTKLKVVKVRSRKLTKANLRNLLSGSNIKTVRLVGMSKAQKRWVCLAYSAWIPAGVTLK